jgi:3-hydroxybutyryl-CoA dehydrogenase
MKQIAVIGGGTMGNGIVHVFAQNGYAVNLIDVKQDMLDKAINTITKNMDRQIAKGTLTEADKNAALSNIQCYTLLADGVANADLVIEAATENVEIKLIILKYNILNIIFLIYISYESCIYNWNNWTRWFLFI